MPRRLALAVLCGGLLLAPPVAHARAGPAGIPSPSRSVAAYVDAARGAILALESAVASDDVSRARRALRRFTKQARLARRRVLTAAQTRGSARSAEALTDLLATHAAAARAFADLLPEAPADVQVALARSLRDVLAGAVPVSAALGDVADRLPEPARVAVAAALAELPLDRLDQLMSDILAAAGSEAVVDTVAPILDRSITALTGLLQQTQADATAALAGLPPATLPPAVLELVQRIQSTVADAAVHLAELPMLEGADLAPLAQVVNGLLSTLSRPSDGTVPSPASGPVGGILDRIADVLLAAGLRPGA